MTKENMSWRGSTGHLDANVPDYQKMLQGHYPSSGWSSMQPTLSSYSSRFPGASGHANPYINQRHNTSSLSRPSSHSGYSNTYQPSKYGLASDSSYNSTLDSNLRTFPTDKSLRQENGYSDKTYGFVGREFDLEPYRSSANRGTDYSSDSGRGPVSRQITDYSSDSGTSFIRHSRKSSDFDLEIPSPDTSHSQSRSQNDELFNSPTKSHLPASEYLRYNDNHALFDDRSRLEHLTEYRHMSKSEPNLEKYQNKWENGKTGQSADEGEIGPQSKDEAIQEADLDHLRKVHEDDDIRSNFVSPEMYHGDLADTTLPNRDTKLHLQRNKASDLTHWQQKLRHTTEPEHNRLVLKPSYHTEKPLRDYTNSIHDNHHDTDRRRHHNTHDMTSQRNHDINGISSHDHHHTSEQVNHIRSAADAIIRDKDAIIDDLKDRVVGQEEMIKELENKLRRSLISRGGNNEDTATFAKMQDLEFRNAELRSELGKLKILKDTEVEDLEIKLGGVEHEVVQLKAALRKSQPNLADMKQKLLDKEEEMGEWKRKHSELTNRYHSLKDKLDGMERYLADLPTLDEFTKNAEDLASCNEDNELKTAQIADMEEKLKDLTQQLSDRDSTIHELEGKQQQLAHKMRELTVEIKRIRSEGEGKALAETQEELAETREMKVKVTQDLQKAKKLLEMNHRRLRQLEAKHQGDMKHVEERLGQEEESVVALREEIRLKEDQVAKLKRSVKEFANKNQDLMDEGLVLKEQLKQFEQTSEDENQKLQRRFVREMSFCFSELQSLVQICVQQAEGKDPNISLLLGTRASLDEEGAIGGLSADEQSLKHWFSKLKELRSEVEKVRNMMCNKYAKDMGDNLNCATQ